MTPAGFLITIEKGVKKNMAKKTRKIKTKARKSKTNKVFAILLQPVYMAKTGLNKVANYFK